MAQEACRKDIERAFGVLQSMFAIVGGHVCFLDKKTLKNIMTWCVILHNMVIEDERDLELIYDNVCSRVKPIRNLYHVQAFFLTYQEIEDANTHNQLQHDLIEHIWQLHGQFSAICIHFILFMCDLNYYLYSACVGL